jgi:CheY-like chemotaxis protein
MVSHELRTPLNAILGWTHVMTSNAADPELLRRGLDVVMRNTRIQAQLISDLLDMSRILSGKLRLTIERVDLAAVIRHAIETVQQSANDKHLQLRHEVSLPEVPIAGDPARLQQVVWNLLSNAIKFTPDGGSIVVRLQRVGRDVELTVADTGVGIGPEFLPHIFDRFQQADVSITRRFGGLGLGLSIVRHLVELHGGTIQAESPGEGKGATFTVTLPSGTPAQAAATTTADASPRVSVSLQGVRIMVVEDETDTNDFLAHFLASCGATVLSARSAADALALFPGSRADVLVSDIGLPETDGYELLRQIRRMVPSDAGGIPAIALTAYARSEDRARAFRAGFQAHLAKPVEPAELLTAIARLLGLVREGDDAATHS